MLSLLKLLPKNFCLFKSLTLNQNLQSQFKQTKTNPHPNSQMACPYFTMIKTLTALVVLMLTLMQLVNLKKKWFPNFIDEKMNNDERDAKYSEENKEELPPVEVEGH